MAPEERTAKAAIMVILVFMVIEREITLFEYSLVMDSIKN